MKKIIIFILLLQVHSTFAGEEANVVINPEMPIAGQSFDVLVRSAVCLPPAESVVIIDGSNIKVFVHLSQGCGLIDPPPPPSVTTLFDFVEINGLDEGQYVLEYYRVGVLEDFLPLVADFPLYFVDEIQFEVGGAPEPTPVNTTSTFGLVIYGLLVFLFFLVAIKRRLS